MLNFRYFVNNVFQICKFVVSFSNIDNVKFKDFNISGIYKETVFIESKWLSMNVQESDVALSNLRDEFGKLGRVRQKGNLEAVGEVQLAG